MKKKLPLHGLRLRLLPPDDATATDLLLLADPSQEQIEKYIQGSHILAALMEGTVVAVCVLSEGGNNNAEIMNLAVGPDHQGRGAGRWLLNKVSGYAATQNIKTLTIATGNSSIGQLYLYQSVGFEITAIEIDHFVRNYPDPIFENGIQCKHKIVLQKVLPKPSSL